MSKIGYFLIALIFLLLNSCSEESETAKQKRSELPQTKSSNAGQTIEMLYDAALDGNLEKVKSFINNGFDVNQANEDGHTVLMLASFNGHTEICEYLLDKDAHIEARDPNGRTALMFASTGPFPETVKLLLDSDANPNSVDHVEKFTPLMHAAAEGHLDVVKILLKNGADKTLKDIDGDTAESFARQNNHTAVADYIKSN